ncbi:1908_t:CDS:2, partial [Acaulospora morrowiae]
FKSWTLGEYQPLFMHTNSWRKEHIVRHFSITTLIPKVILLTPPMQENPVVMCSFTFTSRDLFTCAFALLNSFNLFNPIVYFFSNPSPDTNVSSSQIKASTSFPWDSSGVSYHRAVLL